MLTISTTRLPEVLLIAPQVFGDQRGYFMETYRKNELAAAGISVDFVQDNLSFSRHTALRGLHYQHPGGQGKLVQALVGEIWDVAVDIRVGSPTFGQWVAELLTAANHHMLYIPPGFAHGFCVISETALFSYKCSAYYAPEQEGGVLWNDPDLAIAWPLDQPLLAARDAAWPCLKEIPARRLPGLRSQ